MLQLEGIDITVDPSGEQLAPDAAKVRDKLLQVDPGKLIIAHEKLIVQLECNFAFMSWIYEYFKFFKK